MKEDGIDISLHTSNHIDEYRDVEFDFVISVCDRARESCPYFPSKAQLFHCDFPDPAKATGTEEQIRDSFREVRSMIKAYCKDFAKQNVVSMSSYPFSLITVFHDPDMGFKGNIAGVIELEDEMNAVCMQDIAQDLNQPATSFIWKSKDDEVYNIRWFAPDSEIGLCGHGSLAAIARLCKGVGDSISLRYSGGEILGKRTSHNSCEMLIDPIISRVQEKIPSSVSEGLGVTVLEYHVTGNKEIVIVENEKDLKLMKPDFSKLRESRVFGYIVTTQGDEVDFVSRTIVPHVKILEDPATGSSHAALVPFWSQRLGKKKLTAHQLSKRGGSFDCLMKDTTVHLRGLSETWATGRLTY